MASLESLLHKLIKEEIEKLHPWDERKGDNDKARELLNKLYLAYKKKHAQNKNIMDEIAAIKKAIARARKEANFKGKV